MLFDVDPAEIQRLVAQAKWADLIPVLEDLEASVFPCSALPAVPLVVDETAPPDTSYDASSDAPLQPYDSRLYSLHLACLLLTNALPAARLLHRRTPSHVFKTSWEYNFLCEIGSALHANSHSSAIKLLRSTVPTTPTHVSQLVHVHPPTAVVAVIAPAAVPAPDDGAAGAPVRAFSLLVAPVVAHLAEALQSAALRLAARVYTTVRADSLANAVGWPVEDVLGAARDGSLCTAMAVERVEVETVADAAGAGAVLLKITRGRSQPTSANQRGNDDVMMDHTSASRPGLAQLEDLSRYVVHLERDF
ncbi:hypothetical protein HDU83_001012 [Entophlyctis luteolus]|nr:hypothetical protein HDU83_001012 [Entophlyctis luteolus]